MNWILTLAAWCVVAGIGGGVGNALHMVLSQDVNAVILGSFTTVLTLANSFAFQKFRKIDELNGVAWLDVARREKVRRFVKGRSKLFYARWPACIVFGILTAVLTGLLKVPKFDHEHLLTVCAYGSATLLLVLAVLMNHEYFLMLRIQAELNEKKENMERRRVFLQKVKA